MMPDPMPNLNDDRALTAFLKQHRPIAPAPAPTLEAHLMQTIATQHHLDRVSRTRWWLRVVPAAIAAMVLLSWAGYRLIVPPPLTPQQVSELESFMETAWTGSVSHEMDMTN